MTAASSQVTVQEQILGFALTKGSGSESVAGTAEGTVRSLLTVRCG